MSDKKIGELKKMSMQEAGQDEAQDFTPWLHDNIGALGEALDMILRSIRREKRIGDFWLDLLAKDDNGRTAVIENQFGQTNHDHLGKCLTYAAGCKADVLIWVTEEVRDEHRAAVEWLNQKTNTETEFYLVKVEVLQIDNSPFAYQFIPVIMPDKLQKETYQQEKKFLENTACKEYFLQFGEELREKGFSFKAKSQNSVTRYRLFSCGISSQEGWMYAHEFGQDEHWGDYASVFLYLVGASKSTAESIRDKLNASTHPKKWELAWWNQGYTVYENGAYYPATFSDRKKLLDYVRKWAVEHMLELVKAIPPETLQEIAAEVDAQKPKE